MDPNHLPRFRPGLAAAAVAFFRPADFAAAQRRFVAAMIRARPSGIKRRFFLAGFADAGAATAALALRPGRPVFPLARRSCAGARRGVRCAWAVRRARMRPSFRSLAAW